MTTPTVTEIRRNGNRVGERVELARYTVPAGERVVYCQRVEWVVRVTDVPLRGHGRAYLVERELEHDGYAALKALVADYVLCRRRHSRYHADPPVMPTRGLLALPACGDHVFEVGIFTTGSRAVGPVRSLPASDRRAF